MPTLWILSCAIRSDMRMPATAIVPNHAEIRAVTRPLAYLVTFCVGAIGCVVIVLLVLAR